jgi:methyltransferase (TIGR00027 family)
MVRPMPSAAAWDHRAVASDLHGQPPEQGGVLTGVEKTALGVALIRARETLRPDRLFADPYAQAFVDAAPELVTQRTASRGGAPATDAPGQVRRSLYRQAVLRTRFYDDFLVSAVGQGCQQVVLLAAGLDTRAFRLGFGHQVRLFELDLPGVLAFKTRVLAEAGATAQCARTVVPGDLRADWPAELVKAGYAPGDRTAWLIEGLMIYLTPAEAGNLLAAVTGLSAAGSQLSFEYSAGAASALVSRAQAMPTLHEYASLWKGGLGCEASGWLAGHGWLPQTHSLAEVARSCGREFTGTGGFLTAVREQSRPAVRNSAAC